MGRKKEVRKKAGKKERDRKKEIKNITVSYASNASTLNSKAR